MARADQLDITVIFGQNGEMAEGIRDGREIARDSRRWLKVVSACPAGFNAAAGRGTEGVDQYRVDDGLYKARLDERNCRPRKFRRHSLEIP